MSLKNLNVKIKIPKLLEIKLKNKRISRIYNRFEKSLNLKNNFVVAVSGGPDSLALAFLAKIYSIKKNLSSKFLIIEYIQILIHKTHREPPNVPVYSYHCIQYIFSEKTFPRFIQVHEKSQVKCSFSNASHNAIRNRLALLIGNLPLAQ